MRAKGVRTTVVVLAAGLAGLTLGCPDSNPVSENRKDSAVLTLNPGHVVVDAGDTSRVNANTLNVFGDPTLGGLTFTACDSKVEVSLDPERVDIEPPDRAIVVGKTLGSSCVVATSGGLTDTAFVDVVAAALEVVSAPDTLRAGQTDEVVVQTVDKAGAAVGPFARTDVVYSSGNTASVQLTDSMGSVSAPQSGFSVINAQWSGGGITRALDHTIVVVANVPASAALESSSFPALAAGDSATLEAIVSDVLGNQNTEESEILGITAQSSDAGVAMVNAALVAGSSVQAFITASAVGAGTANVTGTVMTTAGDFALGPATVTVLNPIIGSLTPSSGPPASVTTISGSGFSAAGFETLVLVDGKILGNITVVSDNQIDAQMPTLGTGGTFDVQVTVGGIPSGMDTWTQVGGFDPANSEPANEVPETAPVISLPANFSGSFAGTTAVYDMFRFTLADDATVFVTISWAPAKDLDWILFDCFVSADVFSFACFTGDFIDPSGASLTIDLSAGDYLAVVNDFDAEVNGIPDATTYTLIMERQ